LPSSCPRLTGPTTRKRLVPISSARIAYTTRITCLRRPRMSKSIRRSPSAISALLLGRGLGKSSRGLRLAEGPGKQDTQLVENQQGHHLEQHRDRVAPGKGGRDDRDQQVRVTPVLPQLLDFDDPEAGDGEDSQGQLEDDPAGEHRHREEAVVVAGA